MNNLEEQIQDLRHQLTDACKEIETLKEENLDIKNSIVDQVHELKLDMDYQVYELNREIRSILKQLDDANYEIGRMADR